MCCWRDRGQIVRWLGGLSLLLAAAACGSGSSPPAVRWGPCPEYSRLLGSPECATFAAPLDHDAPDGEQISLFAYRYRGAGETAAQVWLFEGGPGGSGLLLARLAQYLAEHYPQYDVYGLDHRGVGNSTRLSCDDEDALTPFDREGYARCAAQLTAAWGDRLRFFSTTSAARDIRHVTRQTRVSGQRLFLYGTSYGTYWLQRFLQLYPDEVDGVVLDSICPAGSCYLDRYDRWNDSVGGQLLDACAEDPVCGPKLATLAATPRAALAQTYARLAAGELCPAIADRLDRDQLRVALTGLLLSWSQRVLIPPVIYRLDRCGDHDVAALERLFGLAAAPPPPVDEARVYDAPALRDHVLQSELLAGDAVAELEAFAAQALFTADVSLNEARLRETGLWPVYADPDHAQKLATTATPLLMLNGTTDPQTPLELARAAGEHFTGPHQTFVAIPHATHGTVIFSPVDRPLLRDGSPPCGLQLIAQFLADPTAELDRSCVDAVYPLEFSGDSENNRTTSEESLGTPDMWEG